MIESIAITFIQAIVILVASPFMIGLIRKVKAYLQCRQGPNLLQPYFDMAKLFRKDVVASTNTSWIFTATPYILFASTLTATLLVPIFISQTPLNFAGDVIAVVYLLALGTFFLILAGLDAGSSFGGMGSSRVAIVAAMTEPAMILSIFAVGLTAGSTSLSTIVHKTALLRGVVTDPPPHLMALAALFIVTLAETGRVPVDNPSTHLELTMIHEAMVLEYSGRYLALVEWASAMKLLLFMTLISNVFAPWGIATEPDPVWMAFGTAVWLIKISILAVFIGVVESMFAKIRLFRLTDFLGLAFILSLLAIIFFYIFRG
jgi:formate hydrogenlyase subunit 4